MVIGFAARFAQLSAAHVWRDKRRITDRMLAAIQGAQYVIVDLTHERPNVFYEAGYALGLGKIPIYLAREGTKLHFDVKDYPVLYFATMRQLREKVVQRLKNIMKPKKP